MQDFPGRVGFKTPCFPCKEHGFNPWLEELKILHAAGHGQKNKEYNSKNILLIAKCLISQINVALYSVSQGIELQEINWLCYQKYVIKLLSLLPVLKRLFITG